MTEIPDFLIDYLAQRDAQRAQGADELFAGLTDRERGLVHDAAVMGYVQGMRHPQSQPIMRDHQIVALVVQECLAFADLYPTLTGHQPAPDDEDAQQAGGSTAEKAAAVGMTATEYRAHSHEAAVEQVRAAVRGLYADVAIKILSVLDGERAEPERSSREYRLQELRPDGTWECSSGPMDADDRPYALARLARRRERLPDVEQRLVRITTTITTTPEDVTP